MPRYVRLAPAASPAASPAADAVTPGGDWERLLAPAGALAKTGASIYGDPDVSGATSGLMGLLGLGRGIAGGDPTTALIGAGQTGNAVSGLLGGPTVGSLLSEGAAGLGLEGLVSGVGTFLSGSALPLSVGLMPALMEGHGEDFFDSIFGGGKAKQRYLEQKNAPEDFAGAYGRMQRGAATLGAPGDTLDLLRTAQEGIDTRSNIGHNFDIMKNHGADVSGIESLLPDLSSKNWQSWTKLMDRAQAEGVNPFGVVPGLSPEGDPDPANYRSGRLYLGQIQNPYAGWTGLDANGQPSYMPEAPAFSTREANDLSQAIYGYAQAAGKPLTGPLPGATGPGGYLAPDQLEGLGLTPGHYEQGILDYLADPSKITPGLNPEQWFDYEQRPRQDPGYSPGGL